MTQKVFCSLLLTVRSELSVRNALTNVQQEKNLRLKRYLKDMSDIARIQLFMASLHQAEYLVNWQQH